VVTANPQTGQRFSVRLPPNWFEIDLWRASRTGELARLVDRRISENPSMASYRGAIITFLRDVAADAQRRGVVFAAAMAEPLDSERLLLATALAVITDGPPEGDSSVDSIAAQLTTTPFAGHGKEATWRRVALRDIPAGRCVRVDGVETVMPGDELNARGRTAGSASPQAVTMHTLIPVPGSGQVLDLVLTSPHSALAEPMLDLFGAISETLSWTADPPGDGSAQTGSIQAPTT
jgi:hypothetical protein